MKQFSRFIVVILFSLSAFAKSNRKIQQEDMSAGKSKDTISLPGQAAYTPAAPTATAGTAGIGFPAPPSDASNSALNQAIQSFMKYLTGVDQNGNPQNFPDWVNPSVIAREQRAPGLPLITGENLDPSCEGLSPDAKNRMRDYLKGCGKVLQNQTGKVAITDFSTNTPTLYVLNANDLSCAGSTRVTYGVGSHNNPPVAGNNGGSSQSPAGFLVTKPHHGTLYQEWNSVGIEGMGSENSNTAGRGVIFHPSNGHTLGCIGIPTSRFVTVKRAIAYGSVVLNYFPGQIGDSQNRCPYYRDSRSTSSTNSGGVK
jgi:hypothetical protein